MEKKGDVCSCLWLSPCTSAPITSLCTLDSQEAPTWESRGELDTPRPPASHLTSRVQSLPSETRQMVIVTGYGSFPSLGSCVWHYPPFDSCWDGFTCRTFAFWQTRVCLPPPFHMCHYFSAGVHRNTVTTGSMESCGVHVFIYMCYVDCPRRPGWGGMGHFHCRRSPSWRPS